MTFLKLSRSRNRTACAVETRLLAAIRLRFGLAPAPSAATQRLIKRADRLSAYHEATRLAGFAEAEAVRVFGKPERVEASLDALLVPWPTAEAQGAFLARFHALAEAGQAAHAS